MSLGVLLKSDVLVEDSIQLCGLNGRRMNCVIATIPPRAAYSNAHSHEKGRKGP